MKEHGKKDLRIIKTTKNLYEALLYLMEYKTFEEIKICDICEKAMINRSTFYAHFGDKYDLLSSLIKDLKEKLKNELEKNKNISNSKEYYIELLKLLLDHLENEKDIYAPIMIHNKNSIAMDMVYDALSEDIYNRIEKTKQKENTIPSSFITSFYLGAIFNIGMDFIRLHKYTKEEIISYLDLLISQNTHDTL